METRTQSVDGGEVDRFDISLQLTGQALRITVSPGGRGSPVLYVLDPLFLFDVAVGAASLLSIGARLTGGGFRRPTIVGIGYPTDDPAEVFALRARDLTPTDGRAGIPIDLPPLAFGGGERFLDALDHEVLPAAEARHPVANGPRALVGFSFSALFGLYCLFHRPETFSAYILGSPSLWWDDGIAFAWEEAWSRDHADLPARVFLYVGANEQRVGGAWMNEGLPLPVLERLRQVDHLNEMVARLQGRHYPSLHLTSAVLEGEYHLTAPGAALARGMLTVLEDAAT